MAHPLDALDDAALDALPFGVVCLDETLQVLRFNRVESERCGIQRWRVLRRRYFQDVAPRETDRALAAHVRDLLAERVPTKRVVAHTFERRTGLDPTRIEITRGCDRVYLCIHRDDDAAARRRS
jgi:PAS domain-containing protein